MARISRRRTGFSLSRGPVIIRHPQSRISTHPIDLNLAIEMALRNGYIVIPPNQANPPEQVQEENYEDHFHNHDNYQEPSPPPPADVVTQYAMRRDNLSAAWKLIEKSMAAAFFVCQYQTKNWTSSTTYLEPLEECNCPNTHKRPVDLIHTHDRHPKQEVEFCDCIPDPIRLIYLGYIPASPKKPRTAFSIPFIQLFHHIWYESAIPYSSFIDGTVYHQDTRSSTRLLARSQSKNPRELQIPFSEAIDAYRRIQHFQKQLIKTTLSLTIQDEWASKCLLCFGTENFIDPNQAAESEPYAIIAMDGNFQHRHHKFASTDTPTEAQYPSNFILPSKTHPFMITCQATDEDAAAIKTSCSDAHKLAANDVRNSISWDKFDDTGLFGSCCRHDIPLKYNNIEQTGEKLFYPVSIIDHLLKVFPSKRFGILYDIGCHLDAHIQKRNLLGNDSN
ncbi:hypothetical protein PCANC_05159 [Puccinia coronata f. sp. avenae]|uniref:CxC1-like cysteine cluster associated with KDZ transposases domain-containing protein n=1 Tax=Puccinia coronata f. sp. avenae TaxID=200324 RepID=A0A2N5W316_9BASI|nr:hypothetical protein PCANC_05159 [Puccinia coronata f. sp. avenae]